MKDLKFITNTTIIHRGFFDNDRVVENTIKAFKKSNSLKHPYELDVRLTKDEKVIVFHDETLKRLGNIDKKVSDMTYNEISKIKLLGVDTIPLFEDILKLDNKYGIIVEIKNETNNRIIEDKVLELLSNYDKPYSIISFNKNTLKYIKSKNKDIPLGLLINKSKNSFDRLSNKLFIKTFKPDFLSINKSEINNKYVKKYKNPILIWTIKTREDYNKYKNSGTNLVLENINMI